MSRALPAAVLTALTLLAFDSAARAAEVPDVRLGNDVVPGFQSVRLHLDADQRAYSGATHTDLRVARATAIVRLHARGETLDRVTLRQGEDSVAVTIARGDNGLLTLTAAAPLHPGAATLDIEFHADFGTRAVGLYRLNKDGHGYAFTQFESDDAREAFPCWDEPCFKFPYQLTLEVPAAHEAISNTPIASQTSADGWKTIVFEKTPPLPSYLLALATGPLEFTPVPGFRYPVRIVTVQGQRALTGTTIAMLPRILGGLENWFGMPYPFAKLDLVAVPEFAYGAMENPGAITFREDALLLDPATATVDQRRGNVNTTCHELAHMWFGDLVTMSWWDDLWLNESFADWMAAKITDETFPEFQQGLGELQGIQRTMQGDVLPSTTAIRARTTGSAAGLSNVGLVYNKGNAVLSTFENYLGPETFQKGVRAYLKAHAFGNATAADLWQALDGASGQNVSAAMATFTDQPGVPLVRVVPVDGGLRLTQSRCSPWGVSQAPVHWSIPIALRWSDGRTTRTERVLLTAETQVVKLPGRPVWVMPNAGGRGYFAWSAPGALIESLAVHAGDALTPIERISFLGNLDLLLQTGDVHGDAYLRALAHFGGDPEPQVVAGLLSSVRSVQGPLVPDALRPAYAPWVRRTLRPALDRFGFERKAGESDAVGSMRGALLETLARAGDDRDVQAFADAAAGRYLADSSSVDPSVVDAVLGLHARHGDAVMFDELQRRFERATVPQMRRRYLGALGAFEDTALARRALDYGLTKAVRPTESMGTFRVFGPRSDAENARMFAWVTEHYTELAKRLPPPALRFLPMMGSGCSEERLRAAEAFFGDPARALPGIDKSLARIADGVHECRSLREREGAAVEQYLRSLEAK
jgi:alanyl aminopeptidase